MKKNILFAILFTIPTILLSQSQINLGVGAGQQFGYPGLRLGYKWKRIEVSINGGLLHNIGYTIESNAIPKNYSKLEAMNQCLGMGIGIFIKERSFNDNLGTNTSFTYNYGTIFYKTTDNYNITTELKNVHTFCFNHEISSKFLRWRFGYGIGYSEKYETSFNKIYPVFTLGFICKIWQKKSDY
jgi:hypothetical protein